MISGTYVCLPAVNDDSMGISEHMGVPKVRDTQVTMVGSIL